ncbi:ricin-type beta-trefoil lectin domain protein [Streptomyces sp. NBC_00670]|uniref:ricin-type beta-trefoil lectin domain protein n=1 Tax=Streptomyces sp. NBC_00670 TaxID=2975804 RepID=UPI002E378796|nr:ricin-type beta-trefoil lectin domain protein [Streptomyces sp. NBC_00670]
MSGTNDPQHQGATGGATPAPAPDATAESAVTAEPAAAAAPAPAEPAPAPSTPTAPEPAAVARAATPPDAEAETDAGTAAATDTPGTLTAGADEDADGARPSGRPSRGILAGAAVAGALLVGVPFLVSGMLDSSDAKDSPSDRAANAGTVLDDPAADGGGAYGSASPTASPSPSDSEDDGKSGKKDGKKGAKAGAAAGAGADVVAESSEKAAKKGSPGRSSKKKAGGAVATETVISAPGTTLYSHASHRCIEMVGHKGADGSPLEIWDCGKADWQKWDFRSDGTIRSMGLCMDVAWGSRENGAVIQLAVCSGNPAQQFRLNSSNDLVNPQADKCVDVKDQATGNGTRLQLWDCNGQDNQKWSTR